MNSDWRETETKLILLYPQFTYCQKVFPVCGSWLREGEPKKVKNSPFADKTEIGIETGLMDQTSQERISERNCCTDEFQTSSEHSSSMYLSDD